jgi:hypothetical protein
MSSAFRSRSALFVHRRRGSVQPARRDTGALADQKDIPIFSGSVPPGDHTIQVLLTFQGNGYGVFTYLRGYKFEVKSSHSFTAVEGKTLTITATSSRRAASPRRSSSARRSSGRRRCSRSREGFDALPPARRRVGARVGGASEVKLAAPRRRCARDRPRHRPAHAHAR